MTDRGVSFHWDDVLEHVLLQRSCFCHASHWLENENKIYYVRSFACLAIRRVLLNSYLRRRHNKNRAHNHSIKVCCDQFIVRYWLLKRRQYIDINFILFHICKQWFASGDISADASCARTNPSQIWFFKTRNMSKTLYMYIYLYIYTRLILFKLNSWGLHPLVPHQGFALDPQLFISPHYKIVGSANACL